MAYARSCVCDFGANGIIRYIRAACVHTKFAKNRCSTGRRTRGPITAISFNCNALGARVSSRIRFSRDLSIVGPTPPDGRP